MVVHYFIQLELAPGCVYYKVQGVELWRGERLNMKSIDECIA